MWNQYKIIKKIQRYMDKNYIKDNSPVKKPFYNLYEAELKRMMRQKVIENAKKLK